jgi:hypothetical protein
MASADKILLIFFALCITLELIYRVSFIRLQLIFPPLSLLMIYPAPNINTAILAPHLAIPIPSALLIDLSWIALPAWDVNLCSNWVYMLWLPILEELCVITITWRSSFYHLAEWVALTVTIHKGARSFVKFTISKDSHSSKWQLRKNLVSIGNNRWPIWLSLKESTNLQINFDLFHL